MIYKTKHDVFREEVVNEIIRLLKIHKTFNYSLADPDTLIHTQDKDLGSIVSIIYDENSDMVFIITEAFPEWQCSLQVLNLSVLCSLLDKIIETIKTNIQNELL